MTNDGHDTTIDFTSSWARTFLTPLLNNTYFMNNTLVVLTFDEDETYTDHNTVYVCIPQFPVSTSSSLLTSPTDHPPRWRHPHFPT